VARFHCLPPYYTEKGLYLLEKKYIRGLTYSGDWYSATAELWEKYRQAVEADNWDIAQPLEEGVDPDFYYDP